MPGPRAKARPLRIGLYGWWWLVWLLAITWPASLRAATPLADVPLEMRDGFLLVPVRVNGSAPVRFLLKSGSPKTMLSKACAADTGLIRRGRPFKERTASGWDQRWKLRAVSLAIGEAKASFDKLDTGTLAANEPLVGGSLGWDWFSRYVVEIDFSQQRLRLYDPGQYQPSTNQTSVPLRIHQGQPLATLSIPRPDAQPVKVPALVATEYALQFQLNLRFAQSNRLAQLAAPRHFFDVQTSGQYRAGFGHFPRVDLGALALSEVETMLVEDAGNTLGTPLLQRFNLTFDPAHRRLLLTTNAAFDANRSERGFRPGGSFMLRMAEECQINLAGAWVAVAMESQPKFRVIMVRPDTPAHRAGLRRDDELLEINGAPLADMTLAQWMQAIAVPGGHGWLRVTRGKETFQMYLPSFWPEAKP